MVTHVAIGRIVDCVTLVLLVRGVEVTIVLLLGDEGEAHAAQHSG